MYIYVILYNPWTLAWFSPAHLLIMGLGLMYRKVQAEFTTYMMELLCDITQSLLYSSAGAHVLEWGRTSTLYGDGSVDSFSGVLMGMEAMVFQ